MNVKIRIFHLFGMFGVVYNKKLSNMKDRFNKINSKKHFYLDPRNDCIKENIPSNIDLAKHTQFMKQEKVIDYISKILK